MHNGAFCIARGPLGRLKFKCMFEARAYSTASAVSPLVFTKVPRRESIVDFCGKHNIPADVEIIPIQKVNEACERLLKSDVKYRFSIDMASLNNWVRR